MSSDVQIKSIEIILKTHNTLTCQFFWCVQSRFRWLVFIKNASPIRFRSDSTF